MFERIYQGAVIEALKYSPLYEEGMSDDEILAAHGILSYSQTLEWKGAVEYCLTDTGGTLIPHIEGLVGWALENMNIILDHRKMSR